jgi:hypothetical protein
MRKYDLIIYTTLALLVCTMAGCTITGRISRHRIAAEIKHSTLRQREWVEEKQSASGTGKGYIEYTRADSTKSYLIPTVPGFDGESMPTVAIPEVVVTAATRSLPERGGKVSLDFVVTLPRELMGSCRGVEVTPILHRQGRKFPLQELTIRGALFNRVQERNYWQYDRYMDMFDPDPAGEAWAYNRFIYYPYPEGTRLDSVMPDKTTVRYFYTQEVPASEAEGNRLLVTLEGRVVALDHSYYPLPLSDTLEYNISSMLNFVDTTTRYVTRVIEKYAVVNDRSYLNFPVNRAVIIDTLGGNGPRLARIERLMDDVLTQKEFYVDSIVLTASSSPEGSVRQNERLARDRAYALRARLAAKFRRTGMDSLISVRWVGEDWAELVRLVREDDGLANKRAILGMITANGASNRDALEREIKRKYPDDYRHMLSALYPRLRAVDFKYNLRRVGMLKDTIHTTVPDTLYARGVALLKGRRYGDAMKILGGFYDRNAAICLLSLGLDAQAYSVLKMLPENSTHRYLSAIACARLGRESEAVEHLIRAVAFNPALRYRGRLDPEISPLLDSLPPEDLYSN